MRSCLFYASVRTGQETYFGALFHSQARMPTAKRQASVIPMQPQRHFTSDAFVLHLFPECNADSNTQACTKPSERKHPTNWKAWGVGKARRIEQSNLFPFLL